LLVDGDNGILTLFQVAIIVFGIAAAAAVLWLFSRRQRKGFRDGDVADLFQAVEVLAECWRVLDKSVIGRLAAQERPRIALARFVVLAVRLMCPTGELYETRVTAAEMRRWRNRTSGDEARVAVVRLQRRLRLLECHSDSAFVLRVGFCLLKTELIASWRRLKKMTAAIFLVLRAHPSHVACNSRDTAADSRGPRALTTVRYTTVVQLQACFQLGGLRVIVPEK
jgi:hypothetical protein